MAAHVPGVFTETIQNTVKSSKVLVVGAGGIGCELLKNLVLTGFHDIEVVSLTYASSVISTRCTDASAGAGRKSHH